MNEMLIELGKKAKAAEDSLRTISTDKKNQVLSAVADHLVACSETLLKANETRCSKRKGKSYAGRTGRQIASHERTY